MPAVKPLLWFRRCDPARCACALTLLAAGIFLAPAAPAQDADTLIFAPVSGETAATPVPRVFLDCRACDEVYLVREIPFVDYVRDRQVADVHLLITEQRTGSGGSEFALNFIGLKGFLGVEQRLTYTSAQGSTRDEERTGLAQRMKLGLIPYASQTPLADQLAVSYTAPTRPAAPAQESDPWDSWVFEVGGDGSFSGEATRRSFFARGSASASRVTRLWKIRMLVFMDYSERGFERDDQTITSSLKSQRAFGSVVYSLGEYWSAGVFGNAYSTTYENIDLELRLAPALEYSVFPYEESARKELTFAYRVGMQSMNYIEETIFGQTAEMLANESLTATLRVTQPWGNLSVQVEGSHYFHDFSKNRFEFSGSVSVRVFKGLSVRASGSLDIIHDQLYLPGGEGTLEDLLLQQKQLATTYQYQTSVGFSYTFGSIFSNVVNTRL